MSSRSWCSGAGRTPPPSRSPRSARSDWPATSVRSRSASWTRCPRARSARSCAKSSAHRCEEATMAELTLASMFWHRVETTGDRPAQQWKEGGAWRTRPWRETGEIVRELATGLLALGRRKDEAIGILSASRSEWVQADFAIFSAGGRTIPIYPTYPPDLIQYIVNDAEVKTLFVRSEERRVGIECIAAVVGEGVRNIG